MKALLCYLMAVFATVQSELTDANFAKCNQFFYRGIAPTGFETEYRQDLKYICQRYKNMYRFATLYHTTMRMPIYSAYIMKLDEGPRPSGPNFDVEPQLVDINLNAEMLSETDTKAAMNKLNIHLDLLAESQALNADYSKSGYVKGHLNPVADQKGQPSKCATCTLTNAAPMDKTFNNAGWKSYEGTVRKRAGELKCAKMYVLRGVIPGNNWIQVDRVNIPGQVWGAYCCVDKNDNPIESKGGIGNNTGTATVSSIDIAALQQKIPQNITLFDNC